MSYFLSEAYSDLYNPRVDSNFDDNLRFIDSMLDEDIEDVVESLVWEIQDYGNSLDESFNILSLAASDEVITEAYEELAFEFLTESRSQVMARRAMAKQGLEREKGRLQSDLRKDARRSRVDGAISRVKSAIAGARGGMGRAAKSLGGAVTKARADGKARLGQLLRRGVRKAGAVIGGLGKKIEKSGTTAATAPKRTKTYDVPLVGSVSVSRSPSEKTGSKRKMLGRSLRKSGVAVSNMAKSKSSGMSRSDYDKRKAERETTARAKVGKAFAPNGMKKPPLPPRPEAKKPIAALPPAGGTKGREMSPRRKEALAKIQKAAEGKKEKGIRFSASGGIASTKRAHSDILGQRDRFARKALKEYEEILDSILDSLVEEKYAVDHESALNIFLNLSEDMIYELTENFLID
jgi:hypothetical protein